MVDLENGLEKGKAYDRLLNTNSTPFRNAQNPSYSTAKILRPSTTPSIIFLTSFCGAPRLKTRENQQAERFRRLQSSYLPSTNGPLLRARIKPRNAPRRRPRARTVPTHGIHKRAISIIEITPIDILRRTNNILRERKPDTALPVRFRRSVTIARAGAGVEGWHADVEGDGVGVESGVAGQIVDAVGAVFVIAACAALCWEGRGGCYC